MTVIILGLKSKLHNYRVREQWFNRDICERDLGVLKTINSIGIKVVMCCLIGNVSNLAPIVL